MISICDAGDRPLVVQFAASNARDFADAAELVAPFTDGVDLNCGCPQRYEGEPSVEVVHTSLVLRCQKEIPASPVSRSLPYIHTGWGPGNEAGSQHILQISVPSPLTHTHTHRWAMAEGYGAHLIKHPELIADMVSQAGSRSSLPVSIKIRIHNDLRSVGVVKKTHKGQENLATQPQIL